MKLAKVLIAGRRYSFSSCHRRISGINSSGSSPGRLNGLALCTRQCCQGHPIAVEVRNLKASEELDPAFRNVKASLGYRAAELVSYGTKRKPLHVAKKQGSSLIQGQLLQRRCDLAS